MRTFKDVTPKGDCVTTYASDDGFYKIIKRPSRPGYEVKEYSAFNILGKSLGRYPSLEMALYQFKGRLVK